VSDEIAKQSHWAIDALMPACCVDHCHVQLVAWPKRFKYADSAKFAPVPRCVCLFAITGIYEHRADKAGLR
jgi:hypothetical protein